ncbi:serine dehydratase subunit alpha family protein [Enterobacter sp. 63]
MSEQINPLWNHFIRAVQEEVKPALGCTEPVSLALACAIAAEHLPGEVTQIDAWVSPNLMKNGLGVTVPGTGMVGLPIAAALGAIGGNAQAGLEVLKDASGEALAKAKALLQAGRVQVKLQEPCDEILYSRACVHAGNTSAMVTIAGGHTRVVEIVCQGETRFVLNEQPGEMGGDPLVVFSHTTLSQIVEFVEQVPFDAIRFILEAARLNDALSREGLSGKWGLHIGATLHKQRARGWMAQDIGSDIVIRTSAASDARMGGATLPAMSNSGSGNQGITATMPVVVVAEYVQADDERLARALMLSHLAAIYIHYQLPRLSALCAATTAAMGAAAGIAWLMGGNYQTIAMAIGSMIGDVSGIICDGASNSCAMKVSTSVGSAWKAVMMALDDSAVTGNEGIVAHDVEQSIANLCSLACRSMQATDQQIIEIMASKV